MRDQGRLHDAYACLMALDWPQPDLEPYLLKGVLERHLGLLSQAHGSLAMALGHPPHHGFSCYEMGELERSLGRFDAAANWFLAALRHLPTHSWVHQSLQFTKYSKDLLPHVASEYERHCQAHPDDAMAWYLLAELLLRLERKDEAIFTARRAARLQLGEQETWLAAADAEPTPPDFIIIGVPKGGTTSLLHWLSHHPRIWCHPRKELHFFNGAWEQGPSWYSAQFPVFKTSTGVLRGEATPNYFQNPQVPARLARTAPQTRLILLLRDPLKRAISWIEHLRRYEGLTGSTEALLLAELNQLRSSSGAIGSGEATPTSHQALFDSCYDLALARWLQHSANPLLVLRSEDLFQQPRHTLRRCAAFLRVDDQWGSIPLSPQNVNAKPAPGLSASARHTLNQFLNQHSTVWNT